MKAAVLLLLSAAMTVQSFVLPGNTPRHTTPALASPEENAEPPRRLVLSQEEVQAKMAELRSKYPTSEADYLAAARARAAAKTPSNERTATDEDWLELADQKQKEREAWEAANPNSPLIMPNMPDGSDGEDGEDPQLMIW